MAIFLKKMTLSTSLTASVMERIMYNQIKPHFLTISSYLSVDIAETLFESQQPLVKEALLDIMGEDKNPAQISPFGHLGVWCLL